MRGEYGYSMTLQTDRLKDMQPNISNKLQGAGKEGAKKTRQLRPYPVDRPTGRPNKANRATGQPANRPSIIVIYRFFALALSADPAWLEPTGRLRPTGLLRPTGRLRPSGPLRPTGRLRPTVRLRKNVGKQDAVTHLDIHSRGRKNKTTK